MIEKIDELKNNPMFNLSMSSLELFHSNFLEWLFWQNYSAFLKCFDIDEDQNKEYKIQREFILGNKEVDNKKNKKWVTDIAVFAKDKNSIDEKYNGELVLIIENKIKSLPSNGQLESQACLVDDKFNKNCKKVLLTLFELPTGYPFSNFTHIRYMDLIENIRELYKSYTCFDPYIEDYCEMVKILQQIIDDDEVVRDNKEGVFTFHHHSEDLETCGMQDAFRKYQAAQLVQIAKEKFKKLKMPIETGAWFNHKRACVNIFFKLTKNLDAGVQIEHNQFRVYFEGKAIEKLYDKKTGKLSEKAYRFLDKIWNEYLEDHSDGRKKDNCKYGKEFVYRYVIIPPKDEKKIEIEKLLVDGKWLKYHKDLSVKHILYKIKGNEKEIIKELCG